LQELTEWWVVLVRDHYFVESERGNRGPNEWADVILASARYLLGVNT
jgi:hypothetical protein